MASEKKSVERASFRCEPTAGVGGAGGSGELLMPVEFARTRPAPLHERDPGVTGRADRKLCYDRWRPQVAGIPTLEGQMPNIQQQKKRVLIALRQREENLHYRSTIKTLTKRLDSAVASGDDSVITAEHLALVRLIDKAVSNGAMHKNTAGRKKAQAARLVATPAE